MRYLSLVGVLAAFGACGNTATGVRASLAFTPAHEGFKFANYGNDAQVENLTAAELVRMFGPAVCVDGDASDCELTPAAERWMIETNNAMADGHCEGMTSAALLFRSGALVTTDFGARTTYELVLAGNAKLQHELAYWDATQFVAPMSEAEIETLTPSQVVDKLAGAFKTGSDSFTLDVYQPDRSLGHTMTPYAIVDRSATETWLLVYDPDFPGEERHVVVDRATDTWTYDHPDAHYRGDAATHTITLSPMSVRTGKLVCPFCGDVDAAPAGMREIVLDGDADLLIIDDTGKRTGRAGATIVNEIPGAEVIDVKNGGRRAHAHEPVYRVPPGHRLSLAIDGSKLKRATPTDLSVIAAGYTMGVYGILLEPGAHDQLEASADWTEVSYTTQAAVTPDLELGIATSGADYLFEVRATGEPGGQRIDLAVDLAHGTIAVAATAKDGAGRYEVVVHRRSGHKEQTFRHAGVAVGATDRLTFHYAEWRGEHKGMTVGVDHNNDASIDETEELGDDD